MSKNSIFENTTEKEGHPHLLKSLEALGASIEADRIMVEGAYIVKFSFKEGATTTLRISLSDSSGADLVITNMTTLPDSQKHRGFGSNAVQQLLQWAKSNNLKNVRAVQVQDSSEKFWIRNGFIRDKEPNECNDFVYKDSLLKA